MIAAATALGAAHVASDEEEGEGAGAPGARRPQQLEQQLQQQPALQAAAAR
jgi:hypothetical protein